MLVMELENWNIMVCEARRFTEDEKKGFREWFAKIGLVAIGDMIDLKEIDWRDDLVKEICDRPSAGAFCVSSGTSWEISESEKSKLIARNSEYKAEKIAKEKERRILELKRALERCSRARLYSSRSEAVAAAKRYNDINNEGGEGYVPHFWTVQERDSMMKELEELERER